RLQTSGKLLNTRRVGRRGRHFRSKSPGVCFRSSFEIVAPYECVGFPAHSEQAVCLHSAQILIGALEVRLLPSQVQSFELSIASVVSSRISILFKSRESSLCVCIDLGAMSVGER